ncbi:MAG: PAS domain S-box protein, partial [Ghiorsea sp.]
MVDALKLKLPWQVLTLLVMVISMLLFLLWNNLFVSKHRISAHYQQMVVVAGITLQVSQAHLWLEEYVSSQNAKHLQQVNTAITKISNSLDALQNMMPEVVRHSGHDAKSLNQEVESLISLSNTFGQITKQRLDSPLQNKIDDVLDEELDLTYASILSLAKSIENAFKDDFAQYDREETKQQNSIYEHYQYITLNQNVMLMFAQAHLWLEEFVNSQNPKHLPEIKHAMASAFDNIAVLKSVITKLHSGGIANAKLLTHADELTQYAKAFQTIIDQRISSPLQNKTDVPLDESMDIIYENILSVSAQIESDIKDDFSQHETALNQHDSWTFLAVLLLSLFSLWLILFEDKKRRASMEAELEALTNLTGAEKKFATLFELSPISLWLEDFSDVMCKVKELSDSGVQDIHAYCESHPELMMECASRVRILDVNQATLALHGAESKAELMAGLEKTFTEDSLEVFKKEMLEIIDGKTETRHPAKVKKLDGTIVDVIVSVKVMPGHEKNMDRLLVALVDVSDISEAER